MKIIKGLALVAGLFAASPVLAKGFGVEANGANAQDRWGGEVGIGYAVDIGRLSLRPIGGVFIHHDENNPNSRDYFSNGQSRCRAPNGRFTDDGDCMAIAFKGYAKAEAVYVFPRSIEIGGGARFSSDTVRGYATLAVPIGERTRVKANAGDNYYALGVTFGF